MIALFLSPLYIFVNVYVVRWIFLWMGSCHYLFQTMLFRVLFAGGYIFLASALLTGFLIKKPSAFHRFLKVTGNYFLGTFLYILLVIIIADAGHLILKYGFHARFIKSPASFIITGAVCFLCILFLSIYGIVHVWKLQVTPYEVKVEKKVDGMDSLRIILVADTHFGYNTSLRQTTDLAEKINAQNPDLVCFAGDIFDNEYDAIHAPEKLCKALHTIQAKYGVYACWGNHDVNEPILAGFTFGGTGSDYEDPRMEKFMSDAGIHLLEDEAVLIDNRFYLAGRQDISRTEKLNETRKSPAQLTGNLDRSKPVIFIDHQPKELSQIADAGADLVLSGHTHDGQIFPGNLFTRLFWENSCGYLKTGNLHSIVTSGAGVWGPNMRVGTDSEICVINVNFL